MARMRFTKDQECVAECRNFVDRGLRTHPNELRERVVLVTSELVTNVILHTPNGGQLELVVASQHVRVQVSDFSHDQLTELPHGQFALHGRGLPIVASLASTWGVHENSSGKTVWATFG